ncbi:DNA helicase protein [Dioscorea alata]|uniref:DNA helicase protein n=1 Tax=Dioscorea alata TaxID=55571 RepID=A0ACB7UBC8_DIOAL|nr:DNA helicase protein [Dioscorea alata]
MWYDERIDISKSTSNPKFNMCCKQGIISLPPPKPTPPFLCRLFDVNSGVRNSKFKEQIRIYNSLFQFTSLGGIVDNSINQRPGPYVFKLSGQNYHRIGSLLPFAGQTSKFAQLYMIESDAELDCRMSCFQFNDGIQGLDNDIVCGLRNMLDEYNEIVKVFRSAREVHMQFRELPVRIKLIANRNKKDHNYSAPSVPEIAALIVGDIGNNDQGRDIIVEHKQEGLKRISDLHPLFMPLQYPLLFPYGEDCFHLNIPYEESPIRNLQCNSIGKRIILPASFIPGPRYMFEKYQDVMAICRFFGYPKLFITFTCNPRWSEITDTLSSILGQRPEDRPDIISRVFRIKVRHLMDDLIKNHHFGPVKAVVYTVEFQKRGLPHVHILLWLEKESGIMTASEIDKIVSAELPDKRSDPIGYDAVSSFMIHGPCGLANSQAPCMEHGKCKKFYPKAFRNSTTIDEDGFPQYRRRDLPASTSKNGIKLDNRFVVPHNVDLVVRYQAHINVEICNLTRAVKYLFKYISKGPDRARAMFEASSTSSAKTDEIKNYLDCRYLSAYESCWRLFEFPLHHREPSVQRLLIHLPEEHNIYFSDKQFIPNIISIPGIETTMFTEWMATNKLDERGRSLLYTDFPTKFTWYKKEKRWKYRMNGRSIGRIIYIHPSAGELYYLRLLLNEIKGARSYVDLRTINNVVYTTYREACFALGILGDDSEWSNALIQAAHWATGTQLRQLFVTIILYCDVGDKKALFDKHWQLISEDIHYRLRQTYRMPNYTISDENLRNYLLVALEELLNKHSSSLEDNDLPQPQSLNMNNLTDRLLQEELNYNIPQLQEDHLSMFAKLNAQQLAIYTQIQEAINNNGGMFFVYGHGGTGKTFLWNTIINGIRTEGKIVLAVASSGIASLLLPGGRTAHSRFKIPINIEECSTCKISKQTQLARLIEKTTLIVWDEAPMVHRNCLEALNKTLQDLLSETAPEASTKPFGGKTIVLGGDFRQILPVIQYGSKEDIINATITQSQLWKECKVLKLNTNMRLHRNNLDEESRDQLREFAEWLLQIGDGTIASIEKNHNDLDEGDWIEIPQYLLVENLDNPIQSIIEAIYPQFQLNYAKTEYLRQRAIVTPYNEAVDILNETISNEIEADEQKYLSSDYISKSSTSADANAPLYTTEFLNTLKFTGIPNHELTLKIGCVIMLIRNISQTNGLCNGTRLIITQMHHNILEAIIISGSNIGDKVYIPRIIMPVQQGKWPFIMCRKQFPVKLSYAMTINKSQGQTLELVGLFLPKPVFSHGQLYVALSRVSSVEGLKVLILDDNGKNTNKTKNVVYKEIFDSIEINSDPGR